MPDGLLEAAPSLRIEKSSVSDIDGETAEEVTQRLDAQKLQLEKDNRYLESEVQRLQEEINGDRNVRVAQLAAHGALRAPSAVA